MKIPIRIAFESKPIGKIEFFGMEINLEILAKKIASGEFVFVPSYYEDLKTGKIELTEISLIPKELQIP